MICISHQKYVCSVNRVISSQDDKTQVDVFIGHLFKLSKDLAEQLGLVKAIVGKLSKKKQPVEVD